MHSSGISIWFFIGVMLTCYGVMIGGYGIYELISHTTAPVTLAYLHAPLWWGGLMLIAGLFYGIRFRPGKQD